MKIILASTARAAPLIALLSAACVSQSAYEQQGQQLEEARAEATAQQAQIAKMQQEQKWTVAGDLLFPEGGYQLGPSARRRSANTSRGCRIRGTPKSWSTGIPTISQSGGRCSGQVSPTTSTCPRAVINGRYRRL